MQKVLVDEYGEALVANKAELGKLLYNMDETPLNPSPEGAKVLGLRGTPARSLVSNHYNYVTLC